MSKITSIVYSRTLNLGDYHSERLEATVELGEGDEPGEIAGKLKAWVLGQLLIEGDEPGASNRDVRETHQPQQDHYCQQHGVAYRRNENERGEWWSHKTPDGWCKEKYSTEGATNG